MQTLSPVSIPTEEQVFIDKVIGSRRGRPGALLGILEAAQADGTILDELATD